MPGGARCSPGSGRKEKLKSYARAVRSIPILSMIIWRMASVIQVKKSASPQKSDSHPRRNQREVHGSSNLCSFDNRAASLSRSPLDHCARPPQRQRCRQHDEQFEERREEFPPGVESRVEQEHDSKDQPL